MININKFDFNVNDMLDGLGRWINCESPSFDRVAVNKMQDIAIHDLTKIGGRIERITPHPSIGDCVRATFSHNEPNQPGILILGHMDTVHPVGTLKKLPFRRNGDHCYGPGICDMKGGNYIAVEALKKLQESGLNTPLPITVLFTSDEEIGSPHTRELIEAEAKRAKAVLIPEPARKNNGIVSGRYSVSRFEVLTLGRPSHAGLNLSKGRSSIRKMASNILEIESMTDENCTFSVGVVETGKWVNCVSSQTRAEVLSMAKSEKDLEIGIKKMLSLNDQKSEVKTEVRIGLTRPIWKPNKASMKLVSIAEKLMAQINQPFYHESSGGGSDGNFTGALGIPTLDGLGVEGGNYHTLDEYIEISSLALRSKFLAGLLMSIDGRL